LPSHEIGIDRPEKRKAESNVSGARRAQEFALFFGAFAMAPNGKIVQHRIGEDIATASHA